MTVFRALLTVLVAQLVPAGQILATDIYVYARVDGSRLITDHPRSEPGYTLIKLYPAGVDEPAADGISGGQKPLASEFDALIGNVSRQLMLDPALVKAVMHVESAFDPYAVSHKGALGLMQLMPETASRYGVTEVFDPRQNVLGGGRYLQKLLGQFGGNTRLALAGYNAGENAVLRHGGIPPYEETRRYVRKVMSLYDDYRNQVCEGAPGGARVISCSASLGESDRSWVTSLQ